MKTSKGAPETPPSLIRWLILMVMMRNSGMPANSSKTMRTKRWTMNNAMKSWKCLVPHLTEKIGIDLISLSTHATMVGISQMGRTYLR
jgi:hypothetical protein